MSNFGWNDEDRAKAWRAEGSNQGNYREEVRDGASSLVYRGAAPRLCACGERHAPGESCAAFGYAFQPTRNPA